MQVITPTLLSINSVRTTTKIPTSEAVIFHPNHMFFKKQAAFFYIRRAKLSLQSLITDKVVFKSFGSGAWTLIFSPVRG